MSRVNLALIALIGCACSHPRVVGTCFFVAPSGLAWTSLHVVGSADRVRVVDSTGRTALAQVVARDRRLDLAAVHADLEAPAVLPVARSDAALGDHVFAVRAQLRGQQLAEGAVVEQRALGVDFLLATSVEVERGSSGGPLVNDRGEVVGVMIRSSDDRSGAPGPLSFAVKSSHARRALGALPAAGDPAALDPAVRDRGRAIALARRASCMVFASGAEARR